MSDNEDASSGGEEDNGDDPNYYDSQTIEMEREPDRVDIEAYSFECMSLEEIEKFLENEVHQLNTTLNLQDTGVARILLKHFKWNRQEIVDRYLGNAAQTLSLAKVRATDVSSDNNNAQICQICLQNPLSREYRSLDCGHQFCLECWITYLKVQIQEGQSTQICCMGIGCEILTTVEFVTQLLRQENESIRQRYLQFCLNDFVGSHPSLRFCPGRDCRAIVKVDVVLARRVICTQCKTQFCFRCVSDYHAPADCETIKKWHKKCADDSETANYIKAHTKDCPKCEICIEKDGGCNHVQCSKCNHHFCWVCRQDWNLHGQQYYECSRYRKDPEVANSSEMSEAREALRKYLFYYTRWSNHAESLRLEEVTRRKIANRIDELVRTNVGTWIDWQYLQEAADLLARCRYTLQYTYPYAFYLDPESPEKKLFEFQQASLEAEIEDLSWSLERADMFKLGDLHNKMARAEQKRNTLLKRFSEHF